MTNSQLFYNDHKVLQRALTAVALLLALTMATPAWAFEVFLNGVKVTNLRNADLSNCAVKFDGDGNIKIISPGYIVTTDKDGNPHVSGSSDLTSSPSAALKSRFVLTYAPNTKVNFAFELFINDKLFKKIGLDQGPFTVELTQALHSGSNSIRVIAKPGDALPGGGENDIAELRILKGTETADGTSVSYTHLTLPTKRIV